MSMENQSDKRQRLSDWIKYLYAINKNIKIGTKNVENKKMEKTCTK